LKSPFKNIVKELFQNKIAQKTTIQHLLTHTSGLGDYMGDTNASTYQTAYEEFDDFKEILINADTSFEPGSQWSYSNLGYLLLGVIIKNVTGDYYKYVTDNIFQKSGMMDSGFWFFDEVIENAATSYYFDETYNIWRCWVNKPVTRGTSSGGCYSTVADLTKFMNALCNFSLINSFLVHEATTAKPQINSPFYGYGFFINGNEIYHGGNGTGADAKLIHNKDGLTTAILSNVSNGAAEVEKLLFN